MQSHRGIRRIRNAFIIIGLHLWAKGSGSGLIIAVRAEWRSWLLGEARSHATPQGTLADWTAVDRSFVALFDLTVQPLMRVGFLMHLFNLPMTAYPRVCYCCCTLNLLFCDWRAWVCGCTWHHKTFLVQLHWHLAVKLYCVISWGWGCWHRSSSVCVIKISPFFDLNLFFVSIFALGRIWL